MIENPLRATLKGEIVNTQRLRAHQRSTTRRRRDQISSGLIAIAPAGHSAAHSPQPLQ